MKTHSFNDFVNASGNSEPIINIKTVVFSVIGDYVNSKPYSIDINNLAFKKASSLGVNDIAVVEREALKNYPNPFRTSTTIKLNNPSSDVDIQVIDMLGRTVDVQHIQANNNKVEYNAPSLSKGIYKTDKYLVMFLANLLLKENHVLKNREMHVQQIIKTTKSSEKTTKSSEKKSKSSEKILRLIKANTQITIKELAQELGLSTRTIEKNIAKLKLEKQLERIGGDKGGHWHIVE